MDDLTGRELGPYRIVGQIGEGGMAAVYKAYQPSMDRHVAVKVLPQKLASDPTFTQRFENEARMLARLQHPHILPVYDAGQDEGYTYFVMPIVETGTLAQMLQGRPLPLDQACDFAAQVGEALDYAHSRGLVHRDVKPSNVLVDGLGNCLLTDFGIAKLVEAVSSLTAAGTVIGTPAYMSPEQGRGQTLDRRSDIYSLGIILYELVTGRVPFASETPVGIIFKHAAEPPPPPSLLNPSLPASLEAIITKALAKKPEDRYQTAAEMVSAIEDVRDELNRPPAVAATLLEPVPVAVPGRSSAATQLEPLPQSAANRTGAAPAPSSISPAFAAPPARRSRLAGGALLGLGGLGLLGLLAALACGVIFLLPMIMNPAAADPTAASTDAPTARATRRPSATPEAEASPTERIVAPTDDEPLPTAPPLNTPEPLATPTAVFQLSSAPYSHASGAFSLTLPEGWEIDERDSSIFVTSPDEVAAIEVSATNVGLPFDERAMAAFIQAVEDNWFGSFLNYQGGEHQPQADGSIAVFKTLELEGGVPQTAFSYYWQEANIVYEQDFWVDSDKYDAYADGLIAVANSMQTNPAAVAQAPLYQLTYKFTAPEDLFEIYVPYGWAYATETETDAVIDTFTSPDGQSYVENITYDDGTVVSKSLSGAFARALLADYYNLTDIRYTSDVVQADGSERLTWYSTNSGLDGVSFFETRGTTFLLLTWVVSNDYYDTYLPVWADMVNSYVIPQAE